jgi:hypothetical protein
VLFTASAVQENHSMDRQALTSNPFALMMHPEDVVAAMEHSERLARLERRVCKPLDKPVLGHAADDFPIYARALDDDEDAPA